MTNRTECVVIVQLVEAVGSAFLGDRWPEFCHAVEARLQQGAIAREEPGRSDFLRFRYDSPVVALRTAFELLEQIKLVFDWKEESGMVPLRSVLDVFPSDVSSLADLAVESSTWSDLDCGGVYAVRSFWMLWQKTPGGEAEATVTVLEEATNLLRLGRPERPDDCRRLLFPARPFLRAGPGPPCFYCGLRLHPPAECPSKHIGLDVNGVAEAGHINLPALSGLLRQALADLPALGERMRTELSPGTVRRDPVLAAVLAFFDVNRIYQLRFFKYLYFSSESLWMGYDLQRTPDVSDESKFNLSFDCIRVGKYDRALEIYGDKEQGTIIGKFFASIGTAFIALEKMSLNVMANMLENAVAYAEGETEVIYANLLMFRCMTLLAEPERAEEALDNIFRIKGSCDEARYESIRSAAEKGLEAHDLTELERLCAGDMAAFFMVLMDPELQSAAHQVDRVLLAQFEMAYQKARKEITRSRGECAKLGEWFQPDAAEVKEMEAVQTDLEEEFARQGYHDLQVVASRAFSHAKNCSQMVRRKHNQFARQLAGVLERWKEADEFYKGYPHQKMYPLYATELKKSHQLLQEALGRAQMEKIPSQAAADAMEKEIQAKLESLFQMQAAMRKTESIMLFSRAFWRCLWKLEALSLLFTFLLLPALDFIPVEAVRQVTKEIFPDTFSQARLAYVLCIIVAPGWSLFRGLLKMTGGRKGETGDRVKG